MTNKHTRVSDLLTDKPTLDTLRLSKAQKTALYTLIASKAPTKAEDFPAETAYSKEHERVYKAGYNRGLQDYDNAIKDLLK